MTFKTVFMTSLLFGLYMMLGIVQPTDNVDGRTVYTIKTKDFCVEYAYKGEVKEWIQTGTFEYNEDIQD